MSGQSPRRWVCPRCQANNMPGVATCFRCGAPSPSEPTLYQETSASVKRPGWIFATGIALGVTATAAIAGSGWLSLSRPAPTPSSAPAPIPAVAPIVPEPAIRQPAQLATRGLEPPTATPLITRHVRVWWVQSAARTFGTLENTSGEPLIGLSMTIAAPVVDTAGGFDMNPRMERIPVGWHADESNPRPYSSLADIETRADAAFNPPQRVNVAPGKRVRFSVPFRVPLLPADLVATDAHGREVEINQDIHPNVIPRAPAVDAPPLHGPGSVTPKSPGAGF